MNPVDWGEIAVTERKLPESELDVMACLWESGSATAREIREQLIQRRPMTHTSVCTLLRRLEAKGYVVREKGSAGKAFVYRAKIQPGGMHRRLLGDLLDRLFGGSGVALVSSLLETRPPTDEEIDELQQLLQALRSPKPSESKRGKRRKR